MKAIVAYVIKAGILFSLIVIFQSCTTVPINLGIAKEEVIKYHESGQYDRDVAEAVNIAIGKFNKMKVSNKSVVVFDIDETALSNYRINKQLDFGYVEKLWNKWIDSAKAPAVKGVKRLYDFLLSKKIKIIFITGRKDYQYKATYRNLLYAGYKNFDTLIVRNKNEYDLSAQQYKSLIRKELTAKGFHIIGDVGDQYSDLEGPDHGIQVKIPNYQYIIR